MAANNISVSIRVRPEEGPGKTSETCIQQSGVNCIKTTSTFSHESKKFVFDNVYWRNNSQEAIFQDIGQPENKLKVREHPLHGTYVEGCKHVEVHTYEELQTLLQEGSKRRSTAVTKMNENSSRSHTVFTITLSQIVLDELESVTKISKVHLVDLAGSENAKATGAVGVRQREASYINRSLLALGRVIKTLVKNSKQEAANMRRESQFNSFLQKSMPTERNSLAIDLETTVFSKFPAATIAANASSMSMEGDRNRDRDDMDMLDKDDVLLSDEDEANTVMTENNSVICDHDIESMSQAMGSGMGMGMDSSASRRRQQQAGMMVVPYRDSVLTQLLRECLGGNAKTILIATIRAGVEFNDDTLNTLRFAGKAKRVVNNATVNQEVCAMSTIERLQRQVYRAKEHMNVTLTQSSSLQSSSLQSSSLQSDEFDPYDLSFDANSIPMGKDPQTELIRMRELLRDLTLQRDCARQIQELQLQQITDLKQENSIREEKMKEDQRIKEEQIRFLMSMQAKTKNSRETAKHERDNNSISNSNDSDDNESNHSIKASNMEAKGREMYMCLAMRKAQTRAARVAEEKNLIPQCSSALDNIASKILSCYSTKNENG
eukprot:gene7754-15863_t